MKMMMEKKGRDWGHGCNLLYKVGCVKNRMFTHTLQSQYAQMEEQRYRKSQPQNKEKLHSQFWPVSKNISQSGTHSLGPLPSKSTTPNLNLAGPVQSIEPAEANKNRHSVISASSLFSRSLARIIGEDKAQKKRKKKTFLLADLRSRMMQRPLLDSLSVLLCCCSFSCMIAIVSDRPPLCHWAPFSFVHFLFFTYMTYTMYADRRRCGMTCVQ